MACPWCVTYRSGRRGTARKPGQKPPTINLANGTPAQITNVQRTAGGQLQFFDKLGKPVQPRMLKLAPVVRQRIMLTPARPTPVVSAARVHSSHPVS